MMTTRRETQQARWDLARQMLKDEWKTTPNEIGKACETAYGLGLGHQAIQVIRRELIALGYPLKKVLVPTPVPEALAPAPETPAPAAHVATPSRTRARPRWPERQDLTRQMLLKDPQVTLGQISDACLSRFRLTMPAEAIMDIREELGLTIQAVPQVAPRAPVVSPPPIVVVSPLPVAPIPPSGANRAPVPPVTLGVPLEALHIVHTWMVHIMAEKLTLGLDGKCTVTAPHTFQVLGLPQG